MSWLARDAVVSDIAAARSLLLFLQRTILPYKTINNFSTTSCATSLRKGHYPAHRDHGTVALKDHHDTGNRPKSVQKTMGFLKDCGTLALQALARRPKGGKTDVSRTMLEVLV
jgi:hypothetical protein